MGLNPLNYSDTLRVENNILVSEYGEELFGKLRVEYNSAFKLKNRGDAGSVIKTAMQTGLASTKFWRQLQP